VGTSGDTEFKGFLYDLPSLSLFNINNFAAVGFHLDSITRLTDINNSNMFIGVGLVNGVEHGLVGEFVAVPEPSALLLVAVGLTIVVSYKARSTLRGRLG
jgi:hypothetical protein